ncbi:MAG: amidohydrolase family protein [Longimicrobiales bacterium]|nr:amidohydrolase family protein [Longimicrobiales bacterium]
MPLLKLRPLTLPLLLAALLVAPATPADANVLAIRSPGTPAEGTFAFVGVTVIPMDGERLLINQTVIVVDGVITTVGHAGSVEIPEEATRIEGDGRYLMPGLAEMHAHVPPVQEGRPPQEQLEELMFLYIANGITTIRGMLGSPYQIDLARELMADELLGPAFYVAAPSLNGNTAPTPAEAERRMRAAAEAGYDLMKIHPGIPRDAWDRMVEVSREVGLTFGGHVPADVGIRHALESGISTVDHVDGYLEGSVTDAVREQADASGEAVTPRAMLRNLDEAKMRELAELSVAAGVFVVPTQYLWENLYIDRDADDYLSLPEMAYISPQQREAWRRQNAGGFNLTGGDARRFIEARDRMLRILVDAGVPLLMGTDSPQLFNVPGFALHRELAKVADAGIDNYTILESGTRNVGRYVSDVLELDGNFGTVAPGQRADLVLLEANPLDDLGHLTERAGVMVRGRWVSAEEIERGLSEIRARHAN